MDINSYNKFPAQRLSTSEKTEDWHIECAKAGLSIGYFNNQRMRQNRFNKVANYALYDGKMIDEDIERVFNPMGIKEAVIPAKMQNYPIELPTFQRLIGEEGKRKFTWRLRALNDDIVSDILDKKKEDVTNVFTEELNNPNFDKNKAADRLKKIEEFYNYDYQDMREKMGNTVLTYLYQTEFMAEKYNKGFKDVLISSEEIYSCDIVNGEPRFRKCNPFNIYTLRMGESHKIEDCDIIVEDTYKGVGQVIDEYHNYLKDDQIDELYKAHKSTSHTIDVGGVNYSPNVGIPNAGVTSNTGFITMDPNTSNYFGGFFDTEGNVRVIRICWKSMRKMIELTYLDDNGDEQKEIVDEFYKADKSKGEKTRAFWISEWREATRIGSDIFVKCQLYPVNCYDMDTWELKTSPYVGTIYNTNTARGISLMDRVKPYKYQYNIYSRRLEMAFARWKGPIIEMDLAKKPEHWEVNKWMNYAEIHGYLFIDSFAEGQKGLATGKLAGSYNTTGKVLNPDIGNYVQHLINTLEMAKRNIKEISGVTLEREGQSSASQTLGSIDSSIQNSAYITEEWYMLHDNTKLRCLQMMLEVAKIAWRGRQKKLQYILGDLSRVPLEIDGDQFSEINYGLMVNNSTEDAQLLQVIKSMAQASWQNDKMKMSTFMSIYAEDRSIANIRREVEQKEREEQQMVQQQQEQQMQHEQQMQQMVLQQKEIDRQLKQYEIDQNNETRIRVAEINSYIGQKELDLNNNGISDPMEIADMAIKQQSEDTKKQSEERKHDLEQQKLELEEKIAKMKLEGEKYKAEMAYKISKENKNSYDSKKK